MFGKKQRTVNLVLAVLLVGLLLILVNIYQLRALQSDHYTYHGAAAVEGTLDRYDGRKPTVWYAGKRVSDKPLLL